LQNIDKHQPGSLLCIWRVLPGSDLQRPHGLESPGATAMIVLSEFEISGNRLHPAHTPDGHPCVLLVEDDPALRRYLEVVLQRAGYAVITAGDGLEGMRSLLTARVDVIVTDALMPNLDGYGLCRFVRSSQHLAHLPIILLSALDPKNSTDEAEQVNAFLAKPVSPEDLLATCATHLKKN
jgi:twitching motility two-component system response regulator PilH